MRRNASLWTLAAVSGIIMAAGISWTTSQLTSQHIGLSSEPLTAGRRLAPPAAARADEGEAGRTEAHTRSTPSKATATSPSRTGPSVAPTTHTEPLPAAEPSITSGAGAIEGGAGSGATRDDGGGGGGGATRSPSGRDD